MRRRIALTALIVVSLGSDVAHSRRSCQGMSLRGLRDRSTAEFHLRPGTRFLPAQVDTRYTRRIRVVYIVARDQTSLLPTYAPMIRSSMEQALAFFAEQRQVHGFGTKDIEAVRDANGQIEIQTVTALHDFEHYLAMDPDDPTSAAGRYALDMELVDRTAQGELDIDFSHSIVVEVYDIEVAMLAEGGPWYPEGGVVQMGLGQAAFWDDVAHEIGHALGLMHDFNSPLFIMSYGSLWSREAASQARLSAQNVRFLNTSRYVNDAVGLDTGPSSVPVVEPPDGSYDAATDATRLTFRVTDPDGIGAVQFLPTTHWAQFLDQPPGQIAAGHPELYWDGTRDGGGRTDAEYTFEFRADPPAQDPLPESLGGDGIDPIWNDGGIYRQRHRGRVRGVDHGYAIWVIDQHGFLALGELELREQTSPGAWDINGDGLIDIADLAMVARSFGVKGADVLGDADRDGVVTIVDLVMVASHFGEATSAVAAAPQLPRTGDFDIIQEWLTQANRADDGSEAYRAGVAVLKRLLSGIPVGVTRLLPNYPNPLNPETWMPFELTEAADVTVRIYGEGGAVVRSLDLGRRAGGHYTSATDAAYWDGRNELGEQVASGVYVYEMRAGDHRALRRMALMK
ncbi:hypothetical protein CMK11_15015 [Candidatus Poribacteria bacterium]|nr:hypothetical protein [Candidatus Poribacteria bacterium]